MTRTYYTLAVREDGTWTPQFGDYSRKVVQDEMLDYRDHDHKAKNLRIVTSGDTQAEINAATSALNGNGA